MIEDFLYTLDNATNLTKLYEKASNVHRTEIALVKQIQIK